MVKKMGLFDNKSSEEKMIEKEAINEIRSYKNDNYLRFRQIIPRYGITKMGLSEQRFFKKIIGKIEREIKNGTLTKENIGNRVIELLTEKYGEPMSVEATNEKYELQRQNSAQQNEIQLEQKFGIPFRNRVWCKCTIEEMRYSTFTNTNTRDVQNAYVIIEDTHLEIVKESVFLKSKMGSRKIFYENIASIDYDARGRLHLSDSLIINLKSTEHIQLKYVPENYREYITTMYEQYLSGANNVVVETTENNNATSNADELLKYAELLEKGLLTKEEFDLKKAELLGTPTTEVSTTENSKKFCINCGNPVDADSSFCSNCGAQLL